MTESLPITNPTPVVIRHVRRPKSDDTPLVTVLRNYFHAAAGAELEALNGEHGWQNGEAKLALADDGDYAITLPNAAGDDGVLHRDRFALLNDPLYRVGEEWLEVYREPVSAANLLAVFTPARWTLTRGGLELRGPDLLALYALARGSEVDLWHHAPRDVFEHYTRLPVFPLAANFAAWAATGAGTVAAGQPYAGWAYAAASPGSGGVRIAGSLTPPSTITEGSITSPTIGSVDPDNWSADARIVGETARPASSPLPNEAAIYLAVVMEDGTSIVLTLRPWDANTYSPGRVYLTGTTPGGGPPQPLPAGGTGRAEGRPRVTLPDGASLKIIARREWIFGFLEGELVAHARRAGGWARPAKVQVNARSEMTVTVRQMTLESVEPFGLRGATKGDYWLPGAPTPGGLRGRYWNEAPTAASLAVADPNFSAALLAAMLDTVTEPGDSRLDPTINFPAPASGNATWQPAAAQPSGGRFSARWTGSIYLDLSGNGRRLRLSTKDDCARVYVGRTLFGQEAIDKWNATAETDLRTPNLQATLGTASGWYPIVIEYANHAGGPGGLVLEESALDGSGTPTGGWTVVPASKLSPQGCFEEELRLESHREALTAITQAFGYQWRPEPRTLESGEFPGQLIPRIRQGRDTARIVGADEALEIQSEGDAMDAIDRLIVDAAGIADPNGSDQLTGDVLNFGSVAGHLFASTGYESLSEISEEELLVQRATSLLTLRGGPNEQVGVRPQEAGDGELVEDFLLTGALARLRWEPGDGFRLALEDLSVIDATPRQLLAVTWPLYPGGTGRPAVGFRQRPRGLRPFLQRTLRATLGAQRNYQGGLGIVTGNFAISTGDGYSRAPLPANLADVVGADLVLEAIVGSGTLEVNGAAPSPAPTFTSPGRYPLDRWIARDGAGAIPRMRVRLTGATSYELVLELRVRIR